jgi:hypothetical protein
MVGACSLVAGLGDVPLPELQVDSAAPTADGSMVVDSALSEREIDGGLVDDRESGGQGDTQDGDAALPLVAVNPGAGIAAIHLATGQTDLVVVSASGSVELAQGASPAGPWFMLPALTTSAFALQGASVTMALQIEDGLVDALVTGNDGAIALFSAQAGGGAWSRAAPLPAPKAGLPSGARIAAVQQPLLGAPPGPPSYRLDILYADNSGEIWVQWVDRGKPWSQPMAVSSPHATTPGARIATAIEGGVLSVFWLSPASGGGSSLWQNHVANDGTPGTPASIVGNSVFAANGPLSAIVQDVDIMGNRQIDVFAAEPDGRIDITWIDAAGPHGPALMGGNIALPGDALTFHPSAATLGLAWVDTSGTLQLQSVTNGTTDPWSRLMPLSARLFAPPGAPLATGAQATDGPSFDPDGVDLFTVGYGSQKSGTIFGTDESDAGAWPAPAPISFEVSGQRD